MTAPYLVMQMCARETQTYTTYMRDLFRAALMICYDRRPDFFQRKSSPPPSCEQVNDAFWGDPNRTLSPSAAGDLAPYPA